MSLNDRNSSPSPMPGLLPRLHGCIRYRAPGLYSRTIYAMVEMRRSSTFYISEHLSRMVLHASCPQRDHDHHVTSFRRRPASPLQSDTSFDPARILCPGSGGRLVYSTAYEISDGLEAEKYAREHVKYYDVSFLKKIQLRQGVFLHKL